MKGGLLLDVVVRKRTAILKLFASKDQALLIWRDSFLVLCDRDQWKFLSGLSKGNHTDLSLDILDRVWRFNLEGDGLAREGLHENLHDCRLTSSSAINASVEKQQLDRAADGR